MTFLIKLLILVAIAIILQFTAVLASKVGDKANHKRIKQLKEVNKRLVEQNKRYENDYQSIYESMVRANTMTREIKKENEELKKQLEKQSNATYNYYIKCSIPNKDEATPPVTKKIEEQDN
ncbi:hypothetical protein phi9184_ORF062 [Enterococcus phage 9184]|uniref:Uncharacterized protein n=1 Tax=Enterococcus phage 9184 TaxID=2763103 RepID=A0A7L8ZJH7_9CAUD|nr:hypothetical protein phi9184_ORF062 [Enterococcus phage 9184]